MTDIDMNEQSQNAADTQHSNARTLPKRVRYQPGTNYTPFAFHATKAMPQPIDWQPTDEKPRWCAFHGPCKHTATQVSECNTAAKIAADVQAVKEGKPKPSIAADKKAKELKAAKKVVKAQARREKTAAKHKHAAATLHRVSIPPLSPHRSIFWPVH